MGCVNTTLFSPYTQQEIDQEMAKVVPRLPVAELMNGGIIKLEGANGFFNPNSLLDPSWLRGKMTIEDYVQAIDYINKCTGYTHIGLSKMYSTTDAPLRLDLKTRAGMAAVQQINERFPSVHITYQQTAQDMEMTPLYQTDPLMRSMQRGQQPIAHATKVILYINVNN
jgi:hypothetical protein